MCVLSFVGDDWSKRYPQEQQWIHPYIGPGDGSGQTSILFGPEVTKVEFDALKAELESLKKLLKAAKIYDEETGQADCEVEEKVALIKRLAELVDVDLSDIFE